ncbi:hypothetical protein, partial [Mycobacteroides abscessus]|uniref:hypothetical protein n=1 Tax=Mycobacteroides abscessus TaxID=36809 RepID=UPI001F2A3DB3
MRERSTGEIVIDTVDDTLVEGPRPVTSTLKHLRRADLIVGHGLLTSDYRAFHMVAPVPAEILRVTADTLLAFTNARSRIVNSAMPTGLTLTDLVEQNLDDVRTKPAARTRKDTGQDMFSAASGPRPDVDPRADARLVAKVWASALYRGAVGFGAGQDGFTSHYGHSWAGRDGGALAVDDRVIAELLGETRFAARWHTQLSAHGSWVDTPSTRDAAAAELFTLAVHLNDSPADNVLTPLSAIGAALVEADHLTRDDTNHPEQLLSGLQYLGSADNAAVRRVLLDGKPLRA